MDDPMVAARLSPVVLTAEPFTAEWISARLEAGLVVETSEFTCPYVVSGEVPDGVISIAAPFRSENDHFNGVLAQPGSLYVYGPNTEVMNASTGHGRYGVMSIAVHELEDVGTRCGIDLDLPGRGQFRVVPASDRAALERLCSDISTIGRAQRSVFGPETRLHMGDELIDVLAGSLERTGDPTRHNRCDFASIVRACVDRAEKASFQGVTLADLSEAAGVSERHVRTAFSSTFGISPSAYLRILALYETRKALLQPTTVSDPVSRAATQSGFWHLGRFASQYRALFGESPHETASGVTRGLHAVQSVRGHGSA